MVLSLVGLCLALVIGMYFYNNPMRHGRWFMMRRFINWFPLGMTYAFLYMGRYNLTVAKTSLGDLMSKESFGLIFGAGTITYALSFLINGPLVDKIGGKKGILIAALGSAVANTLLGVLTWLVATGKLTVNVGLWFAVLFSLNMYFQSYGAVSIIKVKAYWFHVRERGVFGAIFGTLISFGVYFAFDWGRAIVAMTRAVLPEDAGWLTRTLHSVFAAPGTTHDATWAVFYLPSVLLLGWAVVDAVFIKDTPEEAGFPPFDPCDASSTEADVPLTAGELLRKVFTSPLMLIIAAVELTSGVLRNGIMQWYLVFTKETDQLTSAKFIVDNWGVLLCFFGIAGGFAGGLISDKWFQSRRGPPAMLLCLFMFVMTVLMAVFLRSAPMIVGTAALGISMAVIGVHSLMSGTAAADFGGRRATATCSGVVDGFVYLGTGLQSVSLGFLTSHNWLWWPLFLMPFTLIGAAFAWKIWHALPSATKRYIDQVEKAGALKKT